MPSLRRAKSYGTPNHRPVRGSDSPSNLPFAVVVFFPGQSPKLVTNFVTPNTHTHTEEALSVEFGLTRLIG